MRALLLVALLLTSTQLLAKKVRDVSITSLVIKRVDSNSALECGFDGKSEITSKDKECAKKATIREYKKLQSYLETVLPLLELECAKKKHKEDNQ
jgi:hypothetical protein